MSNGLRRSAPSAARQSLRRWSRGLAAAIVLAFGAGLGSGCRAQQTWPLWQSYADHSIDPQGRVIDHTTGDRTTSEGQSYAMFFALVANDRGRFDHLLAWTESNLAGGDLTLHLPAWSWGHAPDGGWHILDPNPASDADLWLAYDLSEAGRLWREPRYERLAAVLLARIAQQEVAFVPGLGITLLPGVTGFHPNPETWLINPSYLPPFLLRRLAEVDSNGPWSSVLNSVQPLLGKGSGSGFAMDWVAAGTTIRPSLPPPQLAGTPTSATAEPTPVGSYDAIRVYLWLGLTDPGTPELRSWLAQLPGMANLLRTTLTPPARVRSDGIVADPDGPPGFSAAVVPYLRLLGRKNEERLQLNRLNATRDPATGLFGKQAAYYDQNLALFSTGWLEGRFRFDSTGKTVVRWR